MEGLLPDFKFNVPDSTVIGELDIVAISNVELAAMEMESVSSMFIVEPVTDPDAPD